MDNVEDAQPVDDEDVKNTASTIIIVSAVQLIGIVLLVALLCLAKRIKATVLKFKLEEGDKPPPYQPPPSFNAAMKMSHQIQPSGSCLV